MAKKKSAEKPPRKFTKRQLSHIKKQKRRQNIILYGGIAIIAVIVIILLVGVYITQLRPYGQTVIKVYDREFDASYFMDATEFASGGMSFEEFPQYFEQVVQGVPNDIIQSELVWLGATELGITVSDEEVKEYLREQEETIKTERLAQLEERKEQGAITEEEYLEDKEEIEEFEISVNDAVEDIMRASLLSEAVMDENIRPDIPEAADQVNMMVMLLESESQAMDIIFKLEEGEEFGALAEEYSLNYYSEEQKGEMGWHIREVLEMQLESTVPIDYAFNAEIGALSEPLADEDISKPVGYWIVNVLERQEEQAHLQVILVGSQSEANVVMQRIIDGEDFGELAREFSQDEASKEQGGDLGMVTKGQRSAAFDTAIFDTEISDVGIVGPFPDEGMTTQGGHWLVKVVERENNRPLEEEDTQYLEYTAYQDWISQLWEDAAEEIDQSHLTYEVWQWIREKLTGE